MLLLLIWVLFECEQTGSGFIKVLREESEERNLYDFHVGLREGHFGGAFGTLPVRLRSNPAMNDCVPKMEEDQVWI